MIELVTKERKKTQDIEAMFKFHLLHHTIYTVNRLGRWEG
jgi:hypothetical protein